MVITESYDIERFEKQIDELEKSADPGDDRSHSREFSERWSPFYTFIYIYGICMIKEGIILFDIFGVRPAN